MSDINIKKVFFIELHRIIKEYSNIKTELTSPSNDMQIGQDFKLTESEIISLKAEALSQESITAIEKIVRSRITGAFFDAFCLLDGVADPQLTKIPDIWPGMKLTDRNDDDEDIEDHDMLHDLVYETYWDWKDINDRQSK